MIKMVDLKKAWRNFREGTSKSLEPTPATPAPINGQVSPPVIEAFTPAEVVAPVLVAPVVPVESPETKLYNQLASMDSDTIISKVLGVPRLPGEAMVLSKLLSDDRFLKWLKIHVLKA